MKRNLSRTFILLIALISALVVMPSVLPEYYLDVLVVLLINAILVVSFRFTALMGELNFAHVALMGAGAYTTAIMVKSLGLPWGVSLPLAGLVPAAVALALSYPLFRMKGFYFFIGSFAAGEAMRLAWTRFDIFGRQVGIENIPPLTLGTINLRNLPAFYFLTLIVAVVSLLILYRLEHSRIGDNLKAIAMQDSLAQSIGVDLLRYKALAFATGAFFAGIAGFLFAHRIGMVDAYQYVFTYNLEVLVWAIFGGLGSFVGPLVGLGVLTGAEEVIHNIGRLEAWSPFIYGILLLVTLLLFPNGLVGLRKRISPLVERLGMRWKGIKTRLK